MMLTEREAREFFSHSCKRWTLHSEIVKLGTEYMVQTISEGRKHILMKIKPTSMTSRVYIYGQPSEPRPAPVIHYVKGSDHLWVIADEKLGDMFGYYISLSHNTTTLYTMPKDMFDDMRRRTRLTEVAP